MSTIASSVGTVAPTTVLRSAGWCEPLTGFSPLALDALLAALHLAPRRGRVPAHGFDDRDLLLVLAHAARSGNTGEALAHVAGLLDGHGADLVLTAACARLLDALVAATRPDTSETGAGTEPWVLVLEHADAYGPTLFLHAHDGRVVAHWKADNLASNTIRTIVTDMGRLLGSARPLLAHAWLWDWLLHADPCGHGIVRLGDGSADHDTAEELMSAAAHWHGVRMRETPGPPQGPDARLLTAAVALVNWHVVHAHTP